MKKIFYLFMISLFIYSCSNVDNNKIENKNDSTTLKKAEKVSTPFDSTDCKNWVDTIIDKYTKAKIISVKSLVITADNTKGLEARLSIEEFLPNKSYICISFTVFGESVCIDKHPSVDFLFSDNTSVTLIGSNQYNCDGDALIVFDNSWVDQNGKNSNFDKLKSFLLTKIKSTRIRGYNKDIETNWSPNASNQFIRTLNCLNKFFTSNKGEKTPNFRYTWHQ